MKETTSSHLFESSKTKQDGSQVTVIKQIKKVERTVEETFEKPSSFTVEISEKNAKGQAAKRILNK